MRVNFKSRAVLSEAVFGDAVTIGGWGEIGLHVESGHMRLSSRGALSGAPLKGAATLWKKLWDKVRTLGAASWHQFKAAIHCAKKQGQRIAQYLRDRWRSVVRRFVTSDPNTIVYEVFASESCFQNVIFMRPEQAAFQQVNMSQVHVIGTNFRNVRFLGVRWWQPKLWRNGLRDEVFILGSADGPLQYRYMPILEETCRNVRLALEEARAYDASADFYVGEMDARRAQLPPLQRWLFSIPAVYRSVSKYGTSVSTAFSKLLSLCIIHMGMSLVLHDAVLGPEFWHSASTAALRTMRVLVSPADTDLVEADSPAQAWLDLGFRVLGLAQLAMLVLAFRARTKRH